MTGLLWRGNSGGWRVAYDKDRKEVRQPPRKGPGAGHGPQHGYRILVIEAEHPITKGMPLRWQHTRDELYQGQRGPAKDMHVLALAFADKAKGGTGMYEPMLWWIPYGKGRAVTTVLGHVSQGDSKDMVGMHCVGFLTTVAQRLRVGGDRQGNTAPPGQLPLGRQAECSAPERIEEQVAVWGRSAGPFLSPPRFPTQEIPSLLLVALVLPLAVYLLILARINRGRRALMVSGPWDFAGILFAASGFLIFGGPALLSSLSLNETWRNFWLRGRKPLNIAHDDLLLTLRIVLFVLYFLVVVAVSALLLWRRRRLTSIYNVNPATIETALGETVERWHLPFVQTGNLLTFEPVVPPSAGLVERTVILEVDVNPALCHVTLLWHPPDSRLRREMESHLAHALAQTPAPASPASDWLLIAAYFLFFLMLVGVSVLLFLWVTPSLTRRRDARSGFTRRAGAATLRVCKEPHPPTPSPKPTHQGAGGRKTRPFWLPLAPR